MHLEGARVSHAAIKCMTYLRLQSDVGMGDPLNLLLLSIRGALGVLEEVQDIDGGGDV